MLCYYSSGKRKGCHSYVCDKWRDLDCIIWKLDTVLRSLFFFIVWSRSIKKNNDRRTACNPDPKVETLERERDFVHQYIACSSNPENQWTYFSLYLFNFLDFNIEKCYDTCIVALVAMGKEFPTSQIAATTTINITWIKSFTYYFCCLCISIIEIIYDIFCK